MRFSRRPVFTFLLIILVITITIFLKMWANSVRVQQDIYSVIEDVGKLKKSGIFLLGSLNGVSPDKAEVDLRVLILACGEEYVSIDSPFVSGWATWPTAESYICGIPEVHVVVFEITKRDVIGYHNPNIRWYSLYNFTQRAEPYSVPFGTYFDVTFRIENTRDRGAELIPDPGYNYPFDEYLVAPSIYLYSNMTNTSLPFLAFPVINTANSFSFSRQYMDPVYPCRMDGLPIMECGDGSIWLERTKSTKTIATLSLVIGWLLVGLSFVLTVSALYTYGSKNQKDPGSKKIPDTIIIFPIATILALPTLRALFPSAPPVGIYYDHIGLYPQLLVLIASAIVMLLMVLYEESRNRIHTLWFITKDLAAHGRDLERLYPRK